MDHTFPISLRKQCDKRGTPFFTLIIKMQILFAHTILMSTSRASSVFPSSYRKHFLTNQCAYFIRAVNGVSHSESDTLLTKTTMQ